MTAIDPKHDAVICVDLQNDFLPGGALAAPQGNQILGSAYAFLAKAKESGVLVVATKDMHPANHISFRAQNGPWPVHCVAGTTGADFPSDFPVALVDIEIHKGTAPQSEAYSGFQGTSLARILGEKQIHRVFCFGLTTEYCVYQTALDAKQSGFEAFVLSDLVAEVVPSDRQQTLARMENDGIRVVSSLELRF